MAEFAELGMTALDHLTDKHGDDAYDRVQRHNPLSSQYKQAPKKAQEQDPVQESSYNNIDDRQSNRSSRRSQPHQHRHTVELPSPERERENYYSSPPAVVNDRDFDRQSETSERVLRSYENEKDDPPRRYPDLTQERSRRYRRDRMSYGYDDRRASSHAGARSRYDDDDSDYDEHTGRRQRPSGRGYEPDRRSRDYDREIIETEVYRGPPRDWGNQRSPSFQGENGEYAVAQYRGNGDVAPYDNKRRSRSRGRRDKDRDDYYGGERERSRSRENEGIKGKLEDTFDTSARGVGAGIVGAVVGGLAGRQFGDKRHNKRDMVIGAVIGGLAVNAAEQKYREWKEDRDEEKRYDDRDYRSRSAMR